MSTLANLDGEESFEPSFLGYADEVTQERISDDELVSYHPPYEDCADFDSLLLF